jgi:hypothetical protein
MQKGGRDMKNVVAAIAGVLSSVCIVAGILLLVARQSDQFSDAQIVAYFADSANRTSDVAGLALMFAGAALYLWFVGGLRSRLAEGGSAAADRAWLVGAAGSSAASLLVVAACLFGAAAFAAVYSGEFTVDPDLARLTESTGAIALFGSVVLSCVAVAATSLAIRRSASMPRWLGWLGLAVIPLAVVEAVILLPVFIIPLWVLAASLAMAIPAGESAPVA